MKKISLVFFILAFAFVNLSAQVVKTVVPVIWTYEVSKISNTETELIFNARIAYGWHLYGQYFEDGGPIRMVIEFEPNSNYEKTGNTLEIPKPKVEKDEIFEIEVQYFENSARFVQKINTKGKSGFKIKADINGQACRDKDGMCVLVTDSHVFEL